VSGNFSGTFALFRGEGEGRFAPKHEWLEHDGKPLRVPAHSDPFFVDQDGDGDLDLLSGSGEGGVFLFPNVGTAKAPSFGASVELVPPVGYHRDGLRLGDGHLTGPQSSTRVWADDLNGDGKLDLLIGDSVSLVWPVDGLDEAEVLDRLAAWEVKQSAAAEALQSGADGRPAEAAMEKYQQEYEQLRKERATFVRDDPTGFVWVLYRK
jgi:hypothetical protein